MIPRLALLLFGAMSSIAADDEYLKWEAGRAKSIALSTRSNGRVGKMLDFRIKSTDRSYNFKLRATWMTPSTIQALARLEQIRRALSADETRKLVTEAVSAGDIVIQIEIDPREGSGVVPSDWAALLGPRSDSSPDSVSVRGTSSPRLRSFPALAPIPPRDYAYEVFWLVFSNHHEDGRPLFSESDTEAVLSVKIQGKEGKVSWPLPEYVLKRK